MKRLATLHRKLVAVCLVVLVLGAVLAATAQADEVFTPRKWVGAWAEGNHSASGLVDIIQGEGWQGESCVDMRVEHNGAYTEKSCNSAGHVAQQEPRNEGYARVWNNTGSNNEIWGWARF